MTGLTASSRFRRRVGQDATDVSVTIDAAVPTDILRRGALYTYEVRLISGTGAVSVPSTLTISVT